MAYLREGLWESSTKFLLNVEFEHSQGSEKDQDDTVLYIELSASKSWCSTSEYSRICYPFYSLC